MGSAGDLRDERGGRAVTLSCGEIEVEEDLLEVRRRGRPLSVEPKVYALIVVLLRNRERLVTKEELLATVWKGAIVSDSSITRCVSIARKVLDGEAQIRAVHGRGYRLVSVESEAPDPSKSGVRELSEPRAPFVGRRRELAALAPVLSVARAGTGRVAVITGEAGAGKTCLARELARRAAEHGIAVYWTRCLSTDEPARLEPWSRLLARMPAASAASRIERPLNPPAPTPRDVARALLERCHHGPVLVVVEDLEHAGSASLATAERVADLTREAPLSFVVSVRCGGPEKGVHALCPPSDALVVDIEGLPLEDAHAFAEAHSPTAFERAPIASLWALSGGNPFYLRIALTAACVPGSAEQIIARAAASAEARAAVAARLCELPEETRELLALASVIGRRFEFSLLTAAAGRSREAVARALHPAVEARLLEHSPEAPDRLSMVHALVREVLYQTLDVADRTALHRAVGKALEAAAPARTADALDRLAFHFSRAAGPGVTERSAEYAWRAGRLALSARDFSAARGHLESALDRLDGTELQQQRCDVLLELAEAQARCGHREQAALGLRLAASLARDGRWPERLAEALLRARSGAFWLDETQVGDLEETREALALLDCRRPDLRAGLLARLSDELASSGALDQAAQTCREARAIAERSQDPGLRARVGLSELALGTPFELGERIALGHAVVAWAEQANAPETAGLAGLCLAASQFEAGDAVAATRRLRRAASLVELVGCPPAYRDSANAGLALAAGRLGEAERCARLMGDLGRDSGIAAIARASRVHLALLDLERANVERGVSLLEALGEEIAEPVARALLAFALARAGQNALARRELERLMLASATQPAQFEDPATLALEALACAELGECARARALYERLSPFAGRFVVLRRFGVLFGSSHRYLGLLAHTMGRREVAAAHFERAIRDNTRVGAYLFATHGEYEYAALLAESPAAADRRRAQQLREGVLEVAQSRELAHLERLCRRARSPG